MRATEAVTPHARIRGQEVTADGASVAVFRGIRYARAPRFGAPQPLDLLGAVDGTRPAPACPQPRGGPELVPGLAPTGALAEDCLALDVWAPPASGGPLPVLVWVHGGSFLIGTTDVPTYDAARLAAAGVVVVSVQYRVGPFGFLDLRALGRGAIANAGLHDLVAALRWVRRHVAGFGGDPASVTVMGESAGAGAILHLLGAPDRVELFDRAIVQSASTGRTFDTGAAATIGSRFLALSGAADLSELADAPADHLVATVGALHADPEVWSIAGLMPFHPCIDDELVGAAPATALAHGAAAGCELVLGATRDEMQLFLTETALEAPRAAKRIARYLEVDEPTTAAVVDAYAASLAADGRRADPIDVWGAIYSDREMLLPARDALDDASTTTTAYGYRFDWDAPTRPDGRPLGAAHGTDLPFTFGRFPDGWPELLGGDADARERVSTELRHAWTSFAATGRPTSPVAGAWPVWDAARRAAVVGAEIGIADDPLGRRGAALRALTG